MTRESAPKGAPEFTVDTTRRPQGNTTELVEVADRLNAIAANTGYSLLGLLPSDVVAEANVVLAERASMFLRLVTA